MIRHMSKVAHLPSRYQHPSNPVQPSCQRVDKQARRCSKHGDTRYRLSPRRLCCLSGTCCHTSTWPYASPTCVDLQNISEEAVRNTDKAVEFNTGRPSDKGQEHLGVASKKEQIGHGGDNRRAAACQASRQRA